MNCYHPNILIIEKGHTTDKETGKKKDKTEFISYTNPSYNRILEEAKITNSTIRQGNQIKIHLIPCGTCQGCRTNKRQEWATRVDLETKNVKNKYFLTLTYNDENLFIPNWWIQTDTGEIKENPGTWTGSLEKEDLRRFINSLRQYFHRTYKQDNCRFFACGEYGSEDKTERPHYHIIIWNTPNLDQDLIFHKRNKNGDPLYIHERISKIWGKGFVDIGKVSWDSITYVTGYVNKKAINPKAKNEYERKGKEPEFAIMSSNPGIGREYYNTHKEEIYKNDEIINSKGKPIKPPKYFDRLLKEENKKLYTEIQRKREKIASKETDKKISQSSQDLKETLEAEEIYGHIRQAAYNRERINQ